MNTRKPQAHPQATRAVVTIPVSEYSDLLFCKHKLMFLEEIQALKNTISGLEEENLRLISEKFSHVSFGCEKEDCKNESV